MRPSSGLGDDACDIVCELMLMCGQRVTGKIMPSRALRGASRPCPASRIARKFGHRTCRADAIAESDDEHCSKFRSSWRTEQVAQSSR
jgi:hypothetical protein